MNARSTLADLRVGEKAQVREVGGERAIARRLMEMGLLPGTVIEIVRVAPLGDPVEIRLRSVSLSIRRAEARAIAITVPAPEGPDGSEPGATGRPGAGGPIDREGA